MSEWVSDRARQWSEKVQWKRDSVADDFFICEGEGGNSFSLSASLLEWDKNISIFADFDNIQVV